MFTLSHPWWEILVRALIIYVFLHVLFRLIGKKQLGEMNPLDFVLLLIVSEAVAGGLISDEFSVTGALISATTLVGASYVLDKAMAKSRKLEEIVEGKTRYVIKDGKILKKALEAENISESDLTSALRHQNIEHVKDVKFALLETNGDITVIKKDKK